MQHFDRIVLGVGGVGSAAAWQLARRGVRTLGIEQFELGHARGSSHGQTRIIRQAYFEHPDYVPLLRRAYELWSEIERESQQKLFARVGLLEVGPPDGDLIRGIQRSATLHGLVIECLEENSARRRFGGFQIPKGYATIFEPTAGVLFVEACVLAMAELARREGAQVMASTQVQQVEYSHDRVWVTTDRGRFSAEAIVVCGGAWSPALFPDLPLRVVRKHLHWFSTTSPHWHLQANGPAFLYETPEGFFYGFPAVDQRGVKVAEHSGGERIDDPAQLKTAACPTDLARVTQFCSQYLRDVSAPVSDHAVCMYTLTPDEHFIIDRHPHHDRSVLAAGLSGHGFKFVPVIGEILAQLTLEGKTPHPIGFLSRSRFVDGRVSDATKLL